MKNRIFRSILYLVALVTASSCQLIYDNYEEAEELSEKFPVTFVMQTRASYDLPPVVESVRLFFFQDGVCKVNQFVGSSNLSVSTSKSTIDGYYDVVVNQEFSLQMGAKYDIYAVMNESGYMSDLAAGSGSTTLADKLASVSVGEMNYQEFLDILDTKLAYDADDALDADEQAFVMLSSKKGYTFQPTTPGEVVTVRMSDEGAAPHPLALLNLVKITSAAPSGSTATDLDFTARVFVQDVQLVNVPDGYYFTDHADASSSTLSDYQIGSANTDGYYTRTWPGTIHENVSGALSREELAEGRIYRVLDNNGKGCWTFAGITQAQIYNSMTHTKRYEANNGNIATFIQTEVDKYFQSHTVPSTPVFGEMTRSGVILSEDSWNISLNQKLYIPENFSSNSAKDQGTTGFLVKLALSAPEMDLSGIPMSFWSSKVTFSGSNEYYSNGVKVEWRANDTSNTYLSRYTLSCWPTNPDKIDVTNPDGKYVFFIGGLSRRKSGTLPNTSIPSTQDGVVLNWNIPTSGSNVVEVFVPLNNNNSDLKPDANDDYSVRRNQRYNVTLHVLKSTCDNLNWTRAAGESSLPVTVKATIEKVTENQ